MAESKLPLYLRSNHEADSTFVKNLKTILTPEAKLKDFANNESAITNLKQAYGGVEATEPPVREIHEPKKVALDSTDGLFPAVNNRPEEEVLSSLTEKLTPFTIRVPAKEEAKEEEGKKPKAESSEESGKTGKETGKETTPPASGTEPKKPKAQEGATGEEGS